MANRKSRDMEEKPAYSYGRNWAEETEEPDNMSSCGAGDVKVEVAGSHGVGEEPVQQNREVPVYRQTPSNRGRSGAERLMREARMVRDVRMADKELVEVAPDTFIYKSVLDMPKRRAQRPLQGGTIISHRLMVDRVASSLFNLKTSWAGFRKKAKMLESIEIGTGFFLETGTDIDRSEIFNFLMF